MYRLLVFNTREKMVIHKDVNAQRGKVLSLLEGQTV